MVNSFILPRLNLPEYDFTYKNDNDTLQILDEIRNKFVKVTPEEWVRQNFIKFLYNELKYPKSLISIESGIISSKNRTDIVVYNKNLSPYLLVECKRSNISITQKTVNQISRYNTKVKAPYIAITNGLVHLIFSINFEKNLITQLNNFPMY